MQRELAQILSFLFKQVMLLWAKDGAWPSNSDPADEEGRWELEMLHGIAADEGACAPQACLTVHGKHSRIPLTTLEESIDDHLISSENENGQDFDQNTTTSIGQ